MSRGWVEKCWEIIVTGGKYSKRGEEVRAGLEVCGTDRQAYIPGLILCKPCPLLQI